MHLWYMILYYILLCYIIHPVSITRFPLTRFSPGAGLLRYVFFIGSGYIDNIAIL